MSRFHSCVFSIFVYSLIIISLVIFAISPLLVPVEVPCKRERECTSKQGVEFHLGRYKRKQNTKATNNVLEMSNSCELRALLRCLYLLSPTARDAGSSLPPLEYLEV